MQVSSNIEYPSVKFSSDIVDSFTIAKIQQISEIKKKLRIKIIVFQQKQGVRENDSAFGRVKAKSIQLF